MKEEKELGLIEFIKRYGTEEACRAYLYNKKWPDGFVCPKCGVKDKPFNIAARNKYQCRSCQAQTSVTAGTVMDKTRTPLKKWFLAIYLMSMDKRGCSALRLKKELDIAYDTAWTISHKLRHAMGERNGRYMLDEIVELDEAFFGAAHTGGKRGRGADKTAVLMALSRNEKGQIRYLKAKVVESVTKNEIAAFAKDNIDINARVFTDGLNLYEVLNANGYGHTAENAPSRNEVPDCLKKLHIIISNAKAFIQGTYHGLDGIHLQAYLDEFTYRFNRRWAGGSLFSHSVRACVAAAPFTRYALIG